MNKFEKILIGLGIIALVIGVPVGIYNFKSKTTPYQLGSATIFKINQVTGNATTSGVAMSNGVGTSTLQASSSPTLDNLYLRNSLLASTSIGLGTSSPSFPFHFVGTDKYSTSAGVDSAVNITNTITTAPTAANFSNLRSSVSLENVSDPGAKNYIAALGLMAIPATNSTLMPTAGIQGYNLTVSNAGSGSLSTMQGVVSSISLSGSGTSTTNIAANISATLSGTAVINSLLSGQFAATVSGLSSATVPAITGVVARTVNSGGSTITQARTLQISSWGITSGSGTNTNTTGLDILAITNTGTMGTVKGVAVASLTGAGTHTNVPYGFYQSGASDYNSLLGNTVIGDSTAISIPTANSSMTIVDKGVTDSQLVLRSQRAAIVSANILGGIDFQSNDTNLTAPGSTTAAIKALATVTHTATAQNTRLAFYTTNTLGIQEMMSLSEHGRLALGTTTPIGRLSIVGSSSLVDLINMATSTGDKTLAKFDFLGYLSVPHIIGNTGNPTIATSTGAGATATSSVVGNDLSGVITLSTKALDTPSASADIVTVTFAQAYGSAPKCVIADANDTVANLAKGIWRYRQSDTTTTSFKIRSGATPLTALTAADYVWVYQCIQ